MSRQCVTCSREFIPGSPRPNISASATSSLDTTSIPRTALETFHLEPSLQGLEKEYKLLQDAQDSWNVETFQSARSWLEFPHRADYWSGPMPFPTTSYEAGNDNYGPKDYFIGLPECHFPAAIETSEKPSLHISRPQTSSSGDYRCYQHGCEGRRFSSSENYRRHIRERSRLDRTTCPFCAAVFTRKSNKDTHVRKGRCKGFNTWLSEQVRVIPTGETLPEGRYSTSDVEQALARGETPVGRHMMPIRYPPDGRRTL